MKTHFADAMRAAMKLTRVQKLMEATHVIQSALLLGRGQTEPADEQAVEGRAIEKFMIDITPDVTRPAIVGTAQALHPGPLALEVRSLPSPKLPRMRATALRGTIMCGRKDASTLGLK